MTDHVLQGRTEREILWFQRRDFLHAAAAWTALGGAASASAQERSNIVQLEGDALINGQRLSPRQTIQTGDQITTGLKPGDVVITSGLQQLRPGQSVTVTGDGSPAPARPDSSR